VFGRQLAAAEALVAAKKSQILADVEAARAAKAAQEEAAVKATSPAAGAPASSKDVEEDCSIKKPGRDFGAEKLARKAAEMPDVDPSIDLAALRKAAQQGNMTDEEKKARGLLYDASKASAVRDEPEEDDEGACDFNGGFDWDADGGEEVNAAPAEAVSSGSPGAEKATEKLAAAALDEVRPTVSACLCHNSTVWRQQLHASRT